MEVFFFFNISSYSLLQHMEEVLLGTGTPQFRDL